MRLLQKVRPLEVKRSFVLSDFIRHHEYNTQAMAPLSPSQYKREVKRANRIVREIPEVLLDRIIKGTFEKRLTAYKKLTWHIGIVRTDEVRVWRGAGGLPKKYTIGSVAHTGDVVRKVLAKNPRTLGARARSAIPSILHTSLSIIQREKYLLPIVIPGGTLDKSGSPAFLDIDDGCMRSIALAVSGKKTIKVYVGRKK